MRKQLILVGAVLTMLASWPALSSAKDINLLITIQEDGQLKDVRTLGPPQGKNPRSEEVVQKFTGTPPTGEPEGKLYFRKSSPGCVYYFYGGSWFRVCS